MDLYVISGLGADQKVLERLEYPKNIQMHFLDWMMPEHQEDFSHYVTRMADRIDDSKPFSLMGYSFGGFLVQEISKLKKTEKIVLLASIRSDKEKSNLMKIGALTGIPKIIPSRLYGDKPSMMYAFFRRLIDPNNPKIMQYFTVRDPYYLKWSIEKIAAWKFEEIPGVIQIMGNKDIVFPIKNSHPDYVIDGGTHLFPVTKPKQVSDILKNVLTI